MSFEDIKTKEKSIFNSKAGLIAKKFEDFLKVKKNTNRSIQFLGRSLNTISRCPYDAEINDSNGSKFR